MREDEKFIVKHGMVTVREGRFDVLHPSERSTLVRVSWGPDPEEDTLRVFLPSEFYDCWDHDELDMGELVQGLLDWLDATWLATEKKKVTRFLDWLKEPSPDPERWETNLEWFDWGWTHRWVKANSQRVHRDLDRLRGRRSALTY